MEALLCLIKRINPQKMNDHSGRCGNMSFKVTEEEVENQNQYWNT
ncbi:unnamed protein product [Tenebrio molitor]|nr:unnamed protein product [Tenebrio molitor]